MCARMAWEDSDEFMMTLSPEDEAKARVRGLFKKVMDSLDLHSVSCQEKAILIEYFKRIN